VIVNLYLNCSFFYIDSTCGKIPSLTAPQSISVEKLRRFALKVKSTETRECTANDMFNANSRRDFLGLALGVSTLFIHSFDAANGAGLPPEEKPKLCDETCEKELENVW
jgi:peptidylprolyl isomerase